MATAPRTGRGGRRGSRRAGRLRRGLARGAGLLAPGRGPAPRRPAAARAAACHAHPRTHRGADAAARIHHPLQHMERPRAQRLVGGRRVDRRAPARPAGGPFMGPGAQVQLAQRQRARRRPRGRRTCLLPDRPDARRCPAGGHGPPERPAHQLQPAPERSAHAAAQPRRAAHAAPAGAVHHAGAAPARRPCTRATGAALQRLVRRCPAPAPPAALRAARGRHRGVRARPHGAVARLAGPRPGPRRPRAGALAAAARRR